MATIDTYKTQLRRADTKAKADEILFRAAKDPQVSCKDYKELLNQAFGTLDDAVRSIRR